MNQGDKFGYEKLLYFNGNLFSDATAFNLKKEQLEILLSASEKDWKSVEPAIFGTLLEQALETDERSQLGAHYTPRSYVERLVRPTVIEPLQEQWQLIQGEVEHILDTESEATHAENVDLAKTVLDDFLKQLREIKVLDPACGSGNFLYVTLDLMKTLE
ncbi:MAG: DNA methyltransferase, partial [Microcystaceae cyanobacterium]